MYVSNRNILIAEEDRWLDMRLKPLFILGTGITGTLSTYDNVIDYGRHESEMRPTRIWSSGYEDFSSSIFPIDLIEW